MMSLYGTTPIQYVEVDGTPLAYREFGDSTDVPLLMLSRFRASVDDWDPAGVGTRCARTATATSWPLRPAPA